MNLSGQFNHKKDHLKKVKWLTLFDKCRLKRGTFLILIKLLG
jgi:hypothetical protein